MKRVKILPSPQPNKILGRKSPAGTAVPYVTIVIKNQIRK